MTCEVLLSTLTYICTLGDVLINTQQYNNRNWFIYNNMVISDHTIRAQWFRFLYQSHHNIYALGVMLVENIKPGMVSTNIVILLTAHERATPHYRPSTWDSSLRYHLIPRDCYSSKHSWFINGLVRAHVTQVGYVLHIGYLHWVILHFSVPRCAQRQHLEQTTACITWYSTWGTNGHAINDESAALLHCRALYDLWFGGPDWGI